MDHESIMQVLNILKTITDGTTHTLALGNISTQNVLKLTDAEKAIATDKGWTIV